MTAFVQRLAVLWLLTVSLLYAQSSAYQCPQRCVCSGSTIRCQKSGFLAVPQFPNFVPSATGGVLQFLTIVRNSIMRLESSVFADHPNLLRLELHSNQLVWIAADAFEGLVNLKHLILRSNRLAYLPENVFASIYRLEELDLSRNELEHLPYSIEGLIYLNKLNLQGNPLYCPCNLVDFSASLASIEHKYLRATCNNPREMYNTPLVDLATRMHQATLNESSAMGFQTVSAEDDRMSIIQKLPYTVNDVNIYRPRPWSQCSKTDFGGQTFVPAPVPKNDDRSTVVQSSEFDRADRTPIIVTKLKNVHTVVGSMVRFVCRGSTRIRSQIFWLLPENANKFIKLYRRRQILEIREVHNYHKGRYTCVIFNKYGKVTSDAILDIIQPMNPKIFESPSATNYLTVTSNSTLTLKCSAKGLPKPTIDWLWYKETSTIQLVTGGRYVVHNYNTESVGMIDSSEDFAIHQTDAYILSENHNTETTSVLTVRNVTEEDADGRYICYASNRIKSARVSSVIRFVLLDQKISQPNDNVFTSYTTDDKNQVNKIDDASYTTLDPNELVKKVIEKARARIEKAIKKTADRLRDPNKRRSSADVASLFRQPNKAALELAKAAEVYEAAIDEVTSILRLRNHAVDMNQTQIDENDDGASGGSSIEGEDPNSRVALGVELSVDQLAIIAQLSGCQESVQVDACAKQLCYHLRYRSIDGTCNNLNNARWGAALTPFKRLLPPQYENGINTPIGWSATKLYFGFPKPPARLVSRQLLGNASLMNYYNKVLDMHKMKLNRLHKPIMSTKADNNSVNFDMYTMKSDRPQEMLFDEDDTYSGMVMQWGQFLDHDLDFTPVDASTSRFSDGLGCNDTCVNDPPCFPILVPTDDPRIKHRCIGFSRSSATCGSGSTSILLGRPRHREQLNQITSFIDASNVYGSDDFENGQLRETLYDEGKLIQGMPTQSGKRLLPFNIQGQVDCQVDPQQDSVPCFKAGDHRSNENLGLLSLHTLGVREHNRLAEELRTLNPHWSGDRIFNEVRKIVGACMQAITYQSWLPMIMGPKGMQMIGLYGGYDNQVNPTISNEFATAAMRFGHTMIPPIVFRLGEDWEPIADGHLLLHQSFFAPDRLIKDGMDPIIRGLLYNGIRDRSLRPPLNSELTEKLFAMAHELALDLASLNVQRGRDHGLPSYTEYGYKFCNLGSSSHPSSFDDLKSRISKDNVLKGLRGVYGHPANIDLFVGGILEDLMPGARVGPTFACIIADQFRRLRSGDRFWYEAPNVFTPSQLAEIRMGGSSLSRIICENADSIKHIQPNAFVRPNTKQDIVSCNRMPKLNLAMWKECPSLNEFYNAYHGTVAQITDTGRVEYNEPEFMRRTRREASTSETDDYANQDNVLDQLITDNVNLNAKISQLESQIDEIRKTIGKL